MYHLGLRLHLPQWDGEGSILGRLPEMPLPAGGKGKRTLEAPSDIFTLQDVHLTDYKRHAGARHARSSHQTPGGGGVLLAPPPLQTDLYFNVQKNT